MIYEIYKTDTFNDWFDSLKDKTVKFRILARLKRISLGNFGDVKSLGNELFEIRFNLAPVTVFITLHKKTKLLFL